MTSTDTCRWGACGGACGLFLVGTLHPVPGVGPRTLCSRCGQQGTGGNRDHSAMALAQLCRVQGHLEGATGGARTDDLSGNRGGHPVGGAGGGASTTAGRLRRLILLLSHPHPCAVGVELRCWGGCRHFVQRLLSNVRSGSRQIDAVKPSWCCRAARSAAVLQRLMEGERPAE